jgi:hypothetical protein
MEKLEFGETAVLEDGTEYVCFARLEENGNDYVYLVSNFKPLKVRFAKQNIVDGELRLDIIQDQELKQHLLELFKDKMGNTQQMTK